MSYINSHKMPGKGVSYQASFKNQKYRRMIWKLEKIYLNEILKKYLKNTKIVHLDFACGTGRIINFLENMTYNSIGIDVSSEMIKVARKTSKSLLIEGDILKTKLLENKKFNLITAFRFFPNAEEYLRKGALDKIIPHLDKDGYLVFNNHRNKDSFFEKIIRFIFKKHYRGLNIKEVNIMIKDYDLELVDIYSMGLMRDSFKKNIPTGLLFYIDLLLGKYLKLNSYGYNQIYVFKKRC